MGTFKADLEILEKLGSQLHDLAGDAAAVKPATTPASGSGKGLVSCTAAEEITRDLVQGALMAAVKERLTETGDVMTLLAKEYKDKDDSFANTLVDLYRNATGDWSVEPPK
ncbi:hypothetical protein [Nocardia brasiliensis]|uniref:hypothetical protein n=1 Tax=Nocardia brasiliensis TaxID=37326 RepID=UPI0024584EA0|nr:hypothetical protein [Nocardia brasiliensis]